MKQCGCGSYAINDRQHGREPGVDVDLCDMCYWRKRASPPENEWRDAILNAMETTGGEMPMEVNPHEILAQVINWNVSFALDPLGLGAAAKADPACPLDIEQLTADLWAAAQTRPGNEMGVALVRIEHILRNALSVYATQGKE